MSERSERNQKPEGRQEETGHTGGEQQGKGAEDKSAVDKAIDKAQEKGFTEKAANVVKGKLKGR